MKEKTPIYRIPYQGSKQSIVKKIYNIINEDLGNTDCLFADNKITKIYDLFCGGGAVGYYFFQKGFEVVMNVLKYITQYKIILDFCLYFCILIMIIINF